MVGGDLIKPRRLAHRLAGEVHIRLRHHQKNVCPAEFDHLRQRAEAQSVAAQIPLVDQALCGHKADVVAGVYILAAIVAKADQQPFRRAQFFENHNHYPQCFPDRGEIFFPRGRGGNCGAKRRRSKGRGYSLRKRIPPFRCSISVLRERPCFRAAGQSKLFSPIRSDQLKSFAMEIS